jgi:hypothetical protein
MMKFNEYDVVALTEAVPGIRMEIHEPIVLQRSQTLDSRRYPLQRTIVYHRNIPRSVSAYMGWADRKASIAPIRLVSPIKTH